MGVNVGEYLIRSLKFLRRSSDPQDQMEIDQWLDVLRRIGIYEDTNKQDKLESADLYKHIRRQLLFLRRTSSEEEREHCNWWLSRLETLKLEEKLVLQNKNQEAND